MGFFDSLWGWADYEPKDWSEAAYKRAYASSGGRLAAFFTFFWGWADYELKTWPDRRTAISYGWFG
jgi:hypothetical protein